MLLLDEIARTGTAVTGKVPCASLLFSRPFGFWLPAMCRLCHWSKGGYRHIALIPCAIFSDAETVSAQSA